MMPYHEKHTRSIAKAISYRVLSIIADTVLIYALTRKIELTAGIVVLSNFISLFIYYFHERIWNKFHFGRRTVESRNS